MHQDPIDSTAFRRGGSTWEYLVFGVVAHALVLASWVADYLDVGWSVGLPPSIKLAVRGPLGMLAYLGIAGWLVISLCMVIFASRRAWLSKGWDVLLLVVPGIVVAAGIAVLLLGMRTSTLLMHQEKAVFGRTAPEGGLFALVLLGPPIAAAFALGALQLSMLAVCAAARGVTMSANRAGGRHGVVGGFGLAVFAACVAAAGGLHQPLVVLASLLATLMVWLSGRSRATLVPASRAALLGSSAVALAAAVPQLWHVPLGDLPDVAKYFLKIAHEAGALLWLCVPPIALLVLLWIVHSTGSVGGAQEQSTSSAARGSWRFLATGGVLLLSGGIGPVALAAQRFAFRRAIHDMIAALSPHIPADVRLPTFDEGTNLTADPAPEFAAGRKRVGFIGGRQRNATSFDGPHCPSLTAPHPALAGATAPLLELDADTAAPRLCCILEALSGAGFRGVQIATRSNAGVNLPGPFEAYQPPLRVIPVRLPPVGSAPAAGDSDSRLVVGHESLLLIGPRGCTRYSLSPAAFTALHNKMTGEFEMSGAMRRFDVSMSTRVSAEQLVRALAALEPMVDAKLDTSCMTPAQMSDLATAEQCRAP